MTSYHSEEGRADGGTPPDAAGVPVSVSRPGAIRGADRVASNRPFYLTQTGVANAVSLDRTQLGFEANTIRIDNPTGQFYFEPISQQTITPYSLGWVIRIRKSEQAALQALTPVSGTSAPVINEVTTIVYEVSRFEPRPGAEISALGGGTDVVIIGPLDTPSDENPNMAGVAVASFGKIWNANNIWYRMRGAIGDAMSAVFAPLAAGNMLFNGATWDRWRGDTIGGGWAQGGVASGVADTGNPLKVGGVYESAPTNVANGQRRNFWTSLMGGILAVTDTPGSAGADSIAALNAFANRSQTAFGTGTPTAVGGFGFNGTTWDRWRNNRGLSYAASAARTATLTLTAIANQNGSALHAVVDVTVMPSGGLTPTIFGLDPASGKYYAILVGTKIVATGTYVFKVGPGFLAVAGAAAQDMLPRTFQITVVPDDATSITYSVGGNLNTY